MAKPTDNKYSKTGLLIIDMQNFFRSMCSSTTIANVEKLIAHFHEHTLPVLFTQHGHTREELTPPDFDGNQLVKKWGPDGSIAKGSRDWEFMPEIAGLASPPGSDRSCVVRKNTYDAFINTSLAEILMTEGIERVVVAGVLTDCCVDTTARGAFNRGYETWVVGDACSSANRRQHEAGLRGFGFAFGEVLETEEVLGRLKG